jgi:hypothetical protein
MIMGSPLTLKVILDWVRRRYYVIVQPLVPTLEYEIRDFTTRRAGNAIGTPTIARLS